MTRVESGPPTSKPTTSTRDYGDLKERLRRWVSARLPEGAQPSVSDLETPSSTGLSSETLLFDVTWQDGARSVTQPCAARLRPELSAVPVFPSYDLDMQFRVMSLVREKTNLPIPPMLWFEPSAEPLGTPFFVMGRVDGQAPPDLKPYVFESWLKVAPLEAQAAVQRRAIAMLSELHRMDVSADELAFLEVDAPGDTPLRRHVNHQRAYYRWVAEDLDLPILDRAFAWLEDHWPAEEGPTAVSWGDSRIGNILWRDFEPVAMLDWEMAAVGPPEIDLAWMIYMHRFFQEVAERFGYEGMPQFMTPADTATTYEALSGYPPRDLDWYLVYAGVRYAIIITRIARRSMHFGETTMPDDAEDLVANRQALEQLLAGTYWTR